ncbi:MAG: peptide chain release factor N(5)-glutamine methyltransferase [Oscillospiraceae bacterium]|nr:peptide chain release factor N(5)-glutamine methyltransferase [Oscillospiraceae bacterium]
MTVSTLFGELKGKLQHEDALFDLNQLFNAHFGKNIRLLKPDLPVSAEQQASIESDVERLASGYPLQYLLGEWEFFGLTLKVGEGVLIPRADTEISVETALSKLNGRKNALVADFCSGTGAIALAIAKNYADCKVFAVELFDEAYSYLCRNISELDMAERVTPVKADVLGDLSGVLPDELDVIVSNPPYITADEMKELSVQVKHEPQTALFGGDDGLKFYRAIAKSAAEMLKKGGWLIFEGGYKQANDIAEIMRQNGFDNIFANKDIAGINRCICGQKPL